MPAGYNPRCVKGSEKSRKDLEDAEVNIFIDAQERAAKRYWDSVIEW